MGMFERLGEKVERFKQEAVSARDESAGYRCRDCRTEIFNEQEQCPECGSTEIERVAKPETTAETAEGEDVGEPDETAAEPDETAAEPDETAAEPDETVTAEDADTTDDIAETEDAEPETEDEEPDVLIEEPEHDEDTET